MKKFLDCISVVGTTPSRFQGTKKYVSTGAVVTTEIDKSEVVEVTYEDRPSRANLSAEAGDILFAKMQGTRKTLLLDSETEENIYSTGFYAVRANPKVITTECLYYLVDSELFLTQKDKHCSGATQKAITNGGLAKIEIRVPPLSEQGVLTEKLRYLTQLIADKRKQLELFDEVIKSRFIEVFGDTKDKIPLGEICNVTGGYSFKSGDISNDGVIKILQIGNVYLDNVTWDTINYLPRGYDEKYSKFLLNEGDIVVALTRPIIQSLGNVKACIVKSSDLPCLLNQRVGRIVPKGEKSVFVEFIYGCLMTEEFTRYVESCSIGCSQPNISTKDIENYLIPNATYEEQKSYVGFKRQTDKSKFEIQKSLEKLEILKKSLIQQYFG